MWNRARLLVFVAAVGCGSVAAEHKDSGVPPGDADIDAPVDAPIDAPPKEVRITAAPATFILHVNDIRDTVITVTNDTDEAVGAPNVAVTGLTLGTMTFSNNTCTASLAPGASCTVAGRVTATSAGQVNFQVTATSNPGGVVMSALSLNAMPACPATCGANGASNCCESAVVPGNAPGATLAGATFYLSHDVGADGKFAATTYPATVSDFRLDKYEVTVGRFRAFVNAGKGTQAQPPAVGSGAHPQLPNTGWTMDLSLGLTADTTALKAALKCDSTYQNWTDTPGANESQPILCTTWYEAMAFCIWDGGFLPTEAEWNYAAAGGSEQRALPWSTSSNPPMDCSYANFKGNNPSGTYCVNGTTGGVNRVGSESPKGDARWGHSDLTGNVAERVLDALGNNYPVPCSNCTGALPSDRARGGSFVMADYTGSFGVTPLRTADRWVALDAALRGPSAFGFLAFGFRCARVP